MRMRGVCLLTILIGCSLAGVVSGAEGEFAALRQEAVQRLDGLKALVGQAEGRGIDTAPERVTIVTAELFLSFADWDASHPEELREAIGAWWRVRDEAEEIGKELPGRELADVAAILDRATAELEAVLERPSSRRATPAVDHSELEIVDGYFHFDGRPTFPSSFNWMPRDPKVLEAYGNIDGIYIAPSQKKLRDARAAFSYHSEDDMQTMGRVFLGHGGMPGWARKAYPEIEVGHRHFTAYDIDHPGTRQVWQALLRDAVPQFAGKKVTQAGYLLANEPHWFSATGEWDTGPVSDFTMAKFRRWLAERHGSVDALNALWGTEFTAFEDVTLVVPVDSKLRGTPVWYDWCRFNMQRVTDWFSFLKSEVRSYDANAKVHIKLIPGHFAKGLRSHGLDFETLVGLQDIIGCDAKITNAPTRMDKDSWNDRYACNWRDLSMAYDFFKSVSPEKLFYDSEFHGLSTVHWRDPNMTAEYVRCIYWLAHLHGLGMNDTWYWSRDGNGSPKRQCIDGFHGSTLTQPLVLDAFGRTMKELNAFAPEMVALATQPKRVRLFYSETAAIQDGQYMDRIYESYKALYHRGLPLGFVTGRMLSDATEEMLNEWTTVIVTEADHVTVEELAALSKYVSQGGSVVVSGESSLKSDEYGRPHATGLATGGGHVHHIERMDDGSLESLLAVVAPPVGLKETNATGKSGCVWRTCPWQDGHLLLVLNLGKSNAHLETTLAPTSCRDLLTDSPHPSAFDLRPFGVKLLHVGGM